MRGPYSHLIRASLTSLSSGDYVSFGISDREQSSSLFLSFQQQSLSGETMDPTLVLGTRFESQFQICVYEHAILRIYISFFSNKPCMGNQVRFLLHFVVLFIG